jgi:hypothetical protein
LRFFSADAKVHLDAQFASNTSDLSITASQIKHTEVPFHFSPHHHSSNNEELIHPLEAAWHMKHRLF